MFLKTRNRKAGLALLLLGGATAFLCGCVRDDLSECRYPLRLRFTYTYNTEQQDLFDAEVPALELFLYDTHSGELAERLSPDVEELAADNSLSWSVPPGSYRVVAWGGVQQRYTFSDIDSRTGAQLHIRTADDGQSVEQRREHLFHAASADITIDGSRTGTHTLDLRKNSNDVSVTVSGLKETERQRLRCTIRSSNGSYAFDGTCTATGQTLYLPYTSHESDESRFEFTTLRLWEGDDSRLTVELLPESAATKAADTQTDFDPKTVFDESLTELLLKNPEVDLELEDTFTIRMEAISKPDGTLSLTIWVNDWKVVDQTQGLA